MTGSIFYINIPTTDLYVELYDEAQYNLLTEALYNEDKPYSIVKTVVTEAMEPSPDNPSLMIKTVLP